MSKEIIQFDQAMFETKLDTMVREKVERIVNAMLDAEADEIANAARYERTGERKAYRAGHYERKLTAKAGRLALKVPKLKGAVFESAVIERYRRREQSVEESLIDMYLAGVSTRQVDDISQLLWGDRMPSQTLSDKLKKVYEDIDSWRTRPLESEYPYVFMDGVWHKRSWGGHVENVSVLVAIGVDSEGHREVIGVAAEMEARRLKAAANCLREGSARRPVPAAGVPGRSPQAHPHERHDRTAQPRDQAVHARRGKLPGREQHAHARVRPHQVRHRQQLVRPALHGYVPAR